MCGSQIEHQIRSKNEELKFSDREKEIDRGEYLGGAATGLAEDDLVEAIDALGELDVRRRSESGGSSARRRDFFAAHSSCLLFLFFLLALVLVLVFESEEPSVYMYRYIDRYIVM